MEEFLTTVVGGVGHGAFDAMLALGIVLIYRTTGVLNFAQSATGSFALYVIYSVSQGYPLWMALGAASAVGAALSVATYGVIAGIRTRHYALTSAVATLAVSILIGQAILVGWGSAGGTLPALLTGASINVGNAVIPLIMIAALFTCAVLAGGLGAFLAWTRAGTMLRALADNPDAARLCGGNVTLLVAGVWAVAGVLATFAAFFAAEFGSFSPDVFGGFLVGALIAAVLGGLRSLTGTLLAAIGVEISRNLVLTYSPDLAAYVQTFLILLLIAVLIVVPRRWLASGTRRLV
jgi:branched-chain amino acid transport system permease protein